MAYKSERSYKLPGRPESYWIATTKESHYPRLSGSRTFDVAVLGGGILGITAALLLKEAGLKVGVIEAGKVVEGVTGHTTAKVTSQHHLIYKDLVEKMGTDRARQYGEANQAALERIATLVDEREISCDLMRMPAYVYAESEEDREKVRAEVGAAQSLGLPSSFVEDPPLPFETKGAAMMRDQAQFHPRKYLCALAREIPGDGSAIFEGTRALEIVDGEPLTVKTEHGTVQATDVIQATHFPFNDKPGKYSARLYQSRSYVLAVRIKEVFPNGMFINASKPTRSLRFQPADGDQVVLVVGDEHRTGHGGSTVEHYRHLEEWARSIYTVKSIDYRWSTQDTMSLDDVPYIGRLAEETPHQYVGTGFYKWGMTNGTAAAMILSDMILGKENPWKEVFDPARINEPREQELMKEAINHTDKMYKEGREKERPGDPSKLGAGEGAVLKIGGELYAAYRDNDGSLHTLDPACQHRGCIVAWNDAEQTWDCP
ncbi:MAG TPA: FAD-dependent oxidoreductase, partial [Methanomicrobiales archaeon]|nr:FAD-dependent oxidoreductase [Methanomicrobiales archaeon]